MKLMYNVQGTQRKEFVKAIGEALGEKPKYRGAPTFAYAVGSFEIDKQGTVTAAEGVALERMERLADLLAMKGYLCESAGEDVPENVGEKMSENADEKMPENAGEDMPENADEKMSENAGEKMPESAEIETPMETAEPEDALQDIEGEAEMRDAAIDESAGLTILLPLEGFGETELSNLRRLIDSKARLISKATGADRIVFSQVEDKLAFPWFDQLPEPNEVKAYTHLIAALGDMAKRQKRVVAKEKEVPNDKYAFRYG